jgi:ABC-2 type transport system ATP-binding protein
MIQVNDLSFTYSSKHANIFQNLSLQLDGGHIYGLLGKNGAGKTTFLKLLAGLRKPQHGSSKILGMESANRETTMLEDFYFLTDETWLPDTTVDGYLDLYAKSYPRFSKELFESSLKEFEINRSHKLKQMSFGQRKKVAISFAFATQCRILVMDEPTNGLDIPSKVQFRKVAANLLTEDRCLILSTHQVRDLESLIDRIIILDNSQILLNETTDKICNTLLFKNLISLENQSGVLYSEFTSKGFITIFNNTEKDDSKLDLEVLFNFATQHPDIFVGLFKPTKV